MKRLAALLACAALVAACGGAQPAEPAGRSGGTAADDRLADELGAQPDGESLAATLKNGHAWYFWWD